MTKEHHIPKKVTALLVYGRLPLVFAGMLCAIGVMWTRNPLVYTFGVLFLFISMSFDLVDGWFAARFAPHSTLAHLAERIMDKIVYSIIFPLIAVGMMWRLTFINIEHTKTDLLHAIFILLLCVTVLIRDNFAHFMRSFDRRREPELRDMARLRTIVAAPVGALLYAHAFYIPEGPASPVYAWISWLGNLPPRQLLFIEIIFLIINFGSIAGYCRKYGTSCLDELCFGDEILRRRILSVFPNALTVMNAMMGLLAVFFAYQGRIREAYLLIIGAAFFDKLDGALARKLGLTEPLPEEVSGKKSHISIGGVMDDISDAVSFCIVPAWIFYILLSASSDPVILMLPIMPVAILYTLFGLVRLIYFTLDKTPVPGFFKGLPTPAAALFVTAPLIMFAQSVQEGVSSARFWGLFCFGLMIIGAFLMNFYPIRYLHLGRYMSRNPWFGRMSAMILIVFVFTPYLGYAAFIYMFLYLMSPLITWRIDPEVAAKETNVAG